MCNEAWNEGRDPRVRLNSVYQVGDLAFAIPHTGLAKTSDSSFGLPSGYTAYHMDPASTRYSINGDRVVGPWGYQGVQGALYSYGWALRAPVLGNPWYYHLADNYRAMFCSMARSLFDQLDLRMNYLEHNDENSWQVEFQRGAYPTAAWKQVNDPAPAAFDGLTPAQRRETHNAVPAPVLQPRQFEGSTSDGGDWGVPDPVFTIQRRAFRRRTLLPS